MRRLFRFAILVVSLGVAVLAAETFLRMRPLAIFTGADELYLNRPEIQSWTFRPGIDTWLRGPDGDSIRFRTNELGLRGAPWGAKARRRIALIGDSFMAGAVLPEESIMASRLEAILAGLGHDVQVLNLGVDRQNPPEEASLWESLRPLADADLVVWCFYAGNDIWPYGRRELRPSGFFRRHSRLYLLLRHLDAARREAEEEAGGGLPDLAATPVPESWLHAPAPDSLVAAGRIQRLRDVVRFYEPDEAFRTGWLEPTAAVIRARLAPLRPDLVVLIPPAESVDGRRIGEMLRFFARPEAADLDAPTRWSAERMREAGLEVLDLSPILRRFERDTGPTYLEWDGHWNASGHDAAARAVAERLSPLLAR